MFILFDRRRIKAFSIVTDNDFCQGIFFFDENAGFLSMGMNLNVFKTFLNDSEYVELFFIIEAVDKIRISYCQRNFDIRSFTKIFRDDCNGVTELVALKFRWSKVVAKPSYVRNCICDYAVDFFRFRYEADSL